MHVAEYKANRRLSNWDPDVFYKFRDVILQQVPTCTIKLRNDLCRNLPRVWAHQFMLDKDKDIAFEVIPDVRTRPNHAIPVCHRWADCTTD